MACIIHFGVYRYTYLELTFLCMERKGDSKGKYRSNG